MLGAVGSGVGEFTNCYNPSFCFGHNSTVAGGMGILEHDQQLFDWSNN